MWMRCKACCYSAVNLSWMGLAKIKTINNLFLRIMSWYRFFLAIMIMTKFRSYINCSCASHVCYFRSPRHHILLLSFPLGIIWTFNFDQSAVRWLIFGIIWILLGRRVWFFPNILAEEATFSELFQFWPSKDEEERPKWTSRLTFAVGSVLIIWLAMRHAPDEAARARYLWTLINLVGRLKWLLFLMHSVRCRYHKRVSNIIDDVLEWSPRLALSNMMEKQQPVFNATQNNNSTDGISPDSEDSASKDVKVDFDSEVLSNDDQEDEETRREDMWLKGRWII